MSETIATTLPAVGQPWHEQGGIFVGSRIIDGQVHHIIALDGIENDKQVEFGDVEAAGAVGEINGHADWRAPDQEDLMLAWINARSRFVQTGGLDSIYWSRSFHHGWPWAVDFEGGYVCYGRRDDEFRVRPFRHVRS